jgi:hypothetical protein
MRIIPNLSIFAAAVVGASIVASCAMMETVPIVREDGFQCDSSAGAYFLPKTQLVIDVTKVKKSGSSQPTYQLALKSQHVTDGRFGFCLDYLASPSSTDNVDIKMYPGTHLLGIVSTDAIDQSRYILQTLIRSLFIIASGNPDFPAYGRDFSFDKPGDTTTVFKGELDPFDAERTAEINKAIHDFGFCIVLPPYSFTTTAASIDTYCQQPERVLHRVGAPALDYRYRNNDQLVERGHRRGEGGLFYRPRLPYPIQVYLRDNPRVPHWRLGIVRVVQMENVAPVVAVGVERTLFTQRKTTLVFDEGTLTNVCIYKASELNQAVNIPLQIVQSVVDLPTEIVQVKINNTKNQQDLVNAQDRLVQFQKNYITFLNNPQAQYTPPANAPAAAPPTYTPANLGDPTKNTYSQLKAGDPDIISAFGTDVADICPTADTYNTTILQQQQQQHGLKYNPVFSVQQ